ncbi:MAG: PAS domain S-box protein [Coleofasciculus sp. S288]|nr:PAS domain S-box protein [Coleofasciculus sp. S288]
MADKSVSQWLQTSILVYSALMILAIGAIIAIVSIAPLYSSLTKDQQRNLFFALKTRTLVIEEYLSRAKDITLQITDRAALRRTLETYNQGEVMLDELVNFSQPILRDALKQSHDLVGISRLDRTGKLVVQVGLPISEEFWSALNVESDPVILPVPISLAGKSYLVVGTPIINRQGMRVGTDIVLFELSRLQQIVEDYTGLGETGETILGTIHHGQVQLFFPRRRVRGGDIENLSRTSAIGLAIEKAIENNAGIFSPKQSRDRSAVIAYSPIAGSNWGIVLTMNPQELYAPVHHQIWLTGSAILMSILLGTGGMVLVLRPLTGKMIIHTDELKRLLQEKTAALQAELNQRQQAEAAIRFQAHLLDTVEQAVMATDLDGVITYWNQFAETLYGWSAVEAVGRNIIDVVLTEASKLQAAEIMSRVSRGESWSGELIMRHRDGTSFPAMVSDSPIHDDQERLIGIVGVSFDISDLKRIEAALQKANEALELRVEERTAQLRQTNEQLHLEIAERKRAEAEIRQLNETLEIKVAQRTAQLEAANQELDSFSYSVSHDLRAPLRHINGFASALAQQLERNDAIADPKVAHYLQAIQDSTTKMKQLIDGLLTLSHLGRRPLDMHPVNMRALVENAIALVQSQIAEGVEHSIEFEIGDLPPVMGDATLLQQVFSNLIDNAVKFSRDRNPTRIAVGTLQDGIFFLKDNGIGFTMEYADQLFGAFQRLHSAKEFEGTGIGLAIVQRIIHRHGGKIWAESQPDQGATFYFQLAQISER